jgi:hypothetical protein
MPTHDEELRFRNEYKRLSAQQRALFDSAMRQMVKDLKAKRPFNPNLRVKPVQGYKGVFEMTWEMHNGVAPHGSVIRRTSG